MSMLSEVHNWAHGGNISKTDKFRIVTRIIGALVLIYGAWLIHPGLSLMVVGIILSWPEKKD